MHLPIRRNRWFLLLFFRKLFTERLGLFTKKSFTQGAVLPENAAARREVRNHQILCAKLRLAWLNLELSDVYFVN